MQKFLMFLLIYLAHVSFCSKLRGRKRKKEVIICPHFVFFWNLAKHAKKFFPTLQSSSIPFWYLSACFVRSGVLQRYLKLLIGFILTIITIDEKIQIKSTSPSLFTKLSKAAYMQLSCVLCVSKMKIHNKITFFYVFAECFNFRSLNRVALIAIDGLKSCCKGFRLNCMHFCTVSIWKCILCQS